MVIVPCLAPFLLHTTTLPGAGLGAGLGLGLSGGQITDESGHAFSLDDFYGEALGAIEDAPDAHFAALHGLAPHMPFDDANAAHADRPPP